MGSRDWRHFLTHDERRQRLAKLILRGAYVLSQQVGEIRPMEIQRSMSADSSADASASLPISAT